MDGGGGARGALLPFVVGMIGGARGRPGTAGLLPRDGLAPIDGFGLGAGGGPLVPVLREWHSVSIAPVK